MNQIDKKVLQFLMSGRIYSDSAIMKNIGISKSELEQCYLNLTKDGYLETYSDFLKKNPEYNNTSKNNSCSTCKCGDNSNCCSKKHQSETFDYDKIKVLTEKAYIFSN